jgi:magnesium transporter
LAYIISQYEQRVHLLTEQISDARRRLSRHEVENSDFIKFVAIEDTLNEYRSSLEGMSRVITQLMENRRHLFKTRDLEALEDVDLHIRQVLVAISSSTHTISSIQNAYSTVANNTLNQRMKALTAITILLAIPNVFYGMYGMNIALPFQGEPWAYPVITSFTVLLILLVMFVAKRLRLF